MKHSKLLILTAAVLAMLMLFSACGSQAISVKNVLNARKEFTDTAPSYTKGEKISDLSGASSNGYDHPLVYFTKQDAEEATKVKHMVYNIDTNSIVWSETASATFKIAVSINNVYLEESHKTVGYFIVMTEKTSNDKPEITTTLYSQTAEKVASASYKISAQDAADLLLFDEKCYRVAADGSITYAFVYPALADFPNVETKYKDLYYGFGDYITVYNETLEIVSRYMLPTYTEDYVYVILKNGNVFLQYAYAADEHSTDYTILEDGEKIMIASEIVNAKNGTAKKVKTDYIVDYAINLTQMGIYAAEAGFNTKKLAVAAHVYRIVDQRIATDECFASIDKNGKISEISWSNNEQILALYRHSEKRWVVETYNHSYLINDKGKMIGDVSNAISFGKHFYASGKIYDDSLTMVYDFRSNDLSVKETIGNSLLLEDQDGALLLFTGGSEPTTLIPKDSNKTYISSSADYCFDNGFIIVQNDKLCEIYNDQGTLLYSVNDIDMEHLALDLDNAIVTSMDSAVLLKLTTTSGDAIYVRLG